MDTQKIHHITSITLTSLVIICISLALLDSKSNPHNASAEENNAPTIESVFISTTTYGQIDDFSSGTITPNSGTTRTIHINGVVQDADGETDITDINSTFYRSGITNAENCTQDNNNCYKNNSCSLAYISSTTKKYDCPINIQYYTDATDTAGRFPNENWVTYVKVLDTAQASSTDSSTTKEIASILSLDIPTSINYGSITLGTQTTSANNQKMTLTQQGNTQSDIMTSGSTMTCSEIGSIPPSNQKYSLGDVGFTHISTTPLTTTPTLVNIFLGYLDDDSGTTTKDLYWNIGVATSSLKGTCTGSNTITAIAH